MIFVVGVCGVPGFLVGMMGGGVENRAISGGATDRRVGVCRLTKRSKPLVQRRGRE